MYISLLTPFAEERLDRAEFLGLKRIQLRVGPGFPISTEEDSLDEARAAADDLTERGFEVVRIGFYRNMIEDEEHLREEEAHRLLNVYRMATGVFHVDTVGVFAGRSRELSIEDNLPLFQKVWKPLVREAEERGLRVAFENCTMYRGYPVRGINLSHCPAAYEMMFEAIDSPAMGIEFDPSHCLKQLIDPVAFLKSFPGRVFNVHAKDHERLEAEQQRFGSYDVRSSRDRFPGFGQIDFKPILEELGTQGYAGPIVIEAERDPDHETEEQIRGGLTRSRDYLNDLLGT